MMKLRKFTLVFLLFVIASAKAQTGTYALRFNAATQKVIIPNNPALQFNGTSNFAIEAWVMPTGGVGTAGTSAIISKYLLNTNKFGYSLELNSTYKITFTLGNNTLLGKTATSSSTLALNKWTHVCATLESGQIKIYINGKLDNTTAWTGGVTDSGTELTLGQRPGLTTNQFFGFLDEVRIWNTARTDAQVKANLMKELAGNETGLVAYYKMSNGSGTTLSDNQSAGGNSGTISSANWKASGCFSGPRQALTFDGTSDYVSFATPPAYNNASTTIEAWIKTTSVLATNRHIAAWGSTTGGYIATLCMNSGKLLFGLDAGSGLTTVTSTKSINTGNWTHVAVVKSANNVSLFINGFLDNSATLTANQAVTVFQLGNLKKNGTQQSGYFPGSMDEVRIWTTARTEEQIRENMMKNLSGSEAGLRAYYRMDQVNGTVLHDQTSNAYNGTLTSFSGTYWVASTAYNSWIGGESSEWSNAANWSNGLPTATQNVGIYKLALGSEANISSNISLNSLVISSSANPTISGSISTTQALATTKNITLLAGSTNNFGTLNVSSANQIIVPENSKVNVSSEMNNAGKLILKSGDTYTAQIKNNGSIKSVGTVILRKSFKAASGWYYVSFPFDVTFANIKVTSTQVAATTNNYKTTTAPYKNIYIAQYNSVRRDQTGNSSSSDSQNWDAVTSGTLVAKKGYAIKVMADIEIDFVGTPNTDMFDTAAKNTTLEINTTNPSATHHSWNLVGLPYTAAYNLDNLSQGTFYYVFNKTSQTFDVIQNGSAYKLNSFAAFFVQATDPTLTFSATGRVLKAPAVESANYDEAEFTLNDDKYSDLTTIRLRENGSSEFEPEKDAVKIMSINDSTPQLWSKSFDYDLAINSLPSNINEVALNTKTLKKGSYKISLNNFRNNNNISNIWLTDSYTGTKTDLLTNNSYSFDSESGITTDRFKIIFQGGMSTGLNQNKNQISTRIINKQLIINGLDSQAKIILTDITGKTLRIFDNVQNNDCLDLNTARGIYILQIITSVKKTEQKILCD